MSDAKFAVTSWNWEDVAMLKEGWSKAKCESFLKRVATPIEDAMVAAGWAEIESHLRKEWG